MLLGVEHIGVGVPDVDKALDFYGDLGFTEIAFDYSGPLPGTAGVAGEDVAEARVIHLRGANPSNLGLGGLRLVQVLDREVPPLPDGIGWGEPGISEICLYTRDYEALHEKLANKGVTVLMEPNRTATTPYDLECGLSYIADPFGGKIELIEWFALEDGWQNATGPHGVNHVAFGVTDMDRTLDFYDKLGFTGMLFDSDGYFEPMGPWYVGREAPRQHMVLKTNPRGGGIEPVQHFPPSPPMHGEWGHAGPMDFGVGTTNLEREVERLKAEGIEFFGDPQTIESDTGSWSYVYVKEPDGNYVCLSESRF